MRLSGKKVAVAGGGAWGCALAHHLAGKGERVTIWSRNPESASRRMVEAVPVEIVADHEGMAEADTVVLAIPAQAMRGVLEKIAPHIRTDAALVNTAKGIEEASGDLLDGIIGSVLPERPRAVLSGPSFAVDVMAGRPVAVDLAAHDGEARQSFVELFSAPRFRVYSTDDVLGVQLGGAYKNVVAIACGAADSMGLGDSARAAIMARGYAELVRLALAMGARESTLSGLSGLGDLVLTCASEQSRNYRFGQGLGSGLSPEESVRQSGLAEGRRTAAAARSLYVRYGVEAPICEAVDLVASGQLTASEAVDQLLRRPPAGER